MGEGGAGADAGDRVTALALDDCALELQELARSESVDLGPWGGIVSVRQYRWLTQQVTERVPVGGDVLDWGCGQGFFSYWLLRNGYRVSAADLHEPALRRGLEARWPQAFTFEPLPDSRQLPFPDGTFDAVLSVGVLEHVVDSGGSETASLREIHRVLVTGGIFVCGQFPNRFGWVEPIVRRVAPAQHWHHSRYSGLDVRRLATGGGFELLTQTRYGFLPRNMAARLPLRYRNSRAVAGAYDLLDRALVLPLGIASQNHGWAARKPVADDPHPGD